MQCRPNKFESLASIVIDALCLRGENFRPMSRQIYISGKFVPQEDAKISVFDHGLLYGDGVFEGLRSYRGKVFRLEEQSCGCTNRPRRSGSKIPMTQDEMCDAVNEAVQRQQASTTATFGWSSPAAPARSASTRIKCSNPQVIIIADAIALYPQELYEKGLEIVTVSVQRNHPAALSPRIKSLNYLNNILAKIEGMQAGCIEALMLNHKGEVAECTGDNIFLVRNGVLHTPPLDAGILEGVTRDAVMEIARAAGIEVREMPLTKHDVYIADECFLTGTAAEMIPVVQSRQPHDRHRQTGPDDARLEKRFKKLTQE